MTRRLRRSWPRLAILLAALALVAAACSGDSSPTTTAASTSTDAPDPTSLVTGTPDPDTVRRAADALLENPNTVTLARAVSLMQESGEPRWVPYLLDMLRLLATPEDAVRVEAALSSITGIEADDPLTAYAAFGTWMYDRPGVNPGSEYIAWKANFYALVDPAFFTVLAQVGDPRFAARIQWGGVTLGGIPELNQAVTIGVAEADYMQPDEPTFGAVINGEVRAYPYRILDHHELANDVLGGEPVALVNCTLCRTGVLFSRRVGDQVLEFKTSGLLINSNKLMVDIPTGTLWESLTGRALAGPLAGAELDRFFVTVTSWEQWVAEHPDTDVVAIPPETGFGYSYQPGEAYQSYYESDELWFPALSVPGPFAAKDEVATAILDGEPFAVRLEDLQREEIIEIATASGTTYLVASTGLGARFYALDAPIGPDEGGGVEPGEESMVLSSGRELPRVQSGQSFWFAWFAVHPDTSTWPE